MKVLTKPGVEKLWANVLDKIKTETDNKANVIVKSVTGESIAINDCVADLPFKGMTVYGKTTQNGTPAPDAPVEMVNIGSSGTITVTVANENADDIQTIAFSTPNGIPGVPVARLGNYADVYEQQWICDEINMKRGVYVQRIKFVNAKDIRWRMSATKVGRFIHDNTFDHRAIPLCTHFESYDYFGKDGVKPESERICIWNNNGVQIIIETNFTTLDEWNAYITENNVIIAYALKTPVETAMSTDIINAYTALRVQNPAKITNDAGVYMQVNYVADTKQYIDNDDLYHEMMSYTHIPHVIFKGSTDGMSKDNEVILSFIYKGAKDYISDKSNTGKRDGGVIYTGYAKVKWQGSSSVAYPKKNYTIKLYADESCETKMPLTLREKWGAQNKYCMKANFIDPTHCRNVIAARLWGKIVTSRSNYDSMPEALRNSPNNGAIDGYPVLVFINEKYMGIYTMNIPKDEWMFGMSDGEGTNTVLCGEYYNDATHFKAPSLIDGTDWDYEVEPADKSWVVDSFNAIYNALSLPETTSDNIAAKKAALEACIDIYSVIDYRIFIQKIGLSDNLGKNQLMLTYDGVLWYISAYDLDTAFGMVWTGSQYRPASYVSSADNNLTTTIYRLYEVEYNARKEEINQLLTKVAISDELMNFAIDIPQEAFMFEAKLWPDMAGANMNGMNQIQDFLNYHETETVDVGIPVPVASDAGKFLRVDSTGAYVLETLTSAEEVGF